MDFSSLSSSTMNSRAKGFSLGTLVSSHSPKTCIRGMDEVAALNWPWGRGKKRSGNLDFSASCSAGHVCLCGLLHHAQPAVLANKSQLHCRDERPWRPRPVLPGRRTHKRRGWHQQINAESHQRHGGGKVAIINTVFTSWDERNASFSLISRHFGDLVL